MFVYMSQAEKREGHASGRATPVPGFSVQLSQVVEGEEVSCAEGEEVGSGGRCVPQRRARTTLRFS